MEACKKNHCTFLAKLPEDLDDRKKIFHKEAAKIDSMRGDLNFWLNKSQIVTLPSLKITFLWLKRQKSFSNGELIKDAMLISMNNILSKHKTRKRLLKTLKIYNCQMKQSQEDML